MIKDLKDLKKLIALCRQEGILAIKIDNIEFQLGNKPTKAVAKTIMPTASNDPFALENIKIPTYNNEELKIDTEELTEEQLLMWSAQSDQTQQ